VRDHGAKVFDQVCVSGVALVSVQGFERAAQRFPFTLQVLHARVRAIAFAQPVVGELQFLAQLGVDGFERAEGDVHIAGRVPQTGVERFFTGLHALRKQPVPADRIQRSFQRTLILVAQHFEPSELDALVDRGDVEIQQHGDRRRKTKADRQ
jgi:hypothetical protein